jgi:hypothetical protein
MSASRVVPTDLIPITEFAALFGFEPEAVARAIETQKYRVEKFQAFYTLPQLTQRWHCSRAQVYSILREAQVRVLDVGTGNVRSKTLVPAETVERIEKSRMGKMT